MTRTVALGFGVATLVLLNAPPLRTAAALDPIAEWSTAASTAASVTGMPPLRTPITLALLHVTMHRAVAAANETGARHLERAQEGSPGWSAAVSASAAAVESGYRILTAEFPSQQPALRLTYDALRAGEPDTPKTRRGLALGAKVAERMLAARANDGRNAVIEYTPGSGAGAWIPTPPGFGPATTAALAHITPFTMSSPSQFRPAGPPSLESKRWAVDYNEVKALGSKDSTVRTAEQTATAWFWEPLAGTVWVPTIRRLARERALDLESSARFHALAFAAFADALIACWDAKFHFNTWRPVTAIRNGGTDRNRRTEPDPDWEPLAVTPDFPEYPAGHACVSAAVAHTIEDFFHRGVAIPARHIGTGEERYFNRAGDLVDEVIEARMLLGVHFRSADEDGAEMGRRIARQIRRSTEW